MYEWKWHTQITAAMTEYWRMQNTPALWYTFFFPLNVRWSRQLSSQIISTLTGGGGGGDKGEREGGGGGGLRKGGTRTKRRQSDPHLGRDSDWFEFCLFLLFYVFNAYLDFGCLFIAFLLFSDIFPFFFILCIKFSWFFAYFDYFFSIYLLTLLT